MSLWNIRKKSTQTGMICCVQLQLVTWTSCFANDEIPQRQLAGLFVNASNTSETNPRKVLLSPRSISFLAANFWGSSEATPQKRTRGHEWHFPKKNRFESMCGSWNHTCTICSPAAFQIWNGTRLVSFLYRQLRALWSTGIKCSEGFRVWTI